MPQQNLTSSKQYVVMFSQMSPQGLTWAPVDAHFNTLEEAMNRAEQLGEWQILEIAATVIKTSKDPK